MNMPENAGKYCFSPSEYHGRLLEEIKPSLGFRSGRGLAKWQDTLKNKLKELLGNRPEKNVRYVKKHYGYEETIWDELRR